jgi:hypothetical protein
MELVFKHAEPGMPTSTIRIIAGRFSKSRLSYLLTERHILQLLTALGGAPPHEDTAGTNCSSSRHRNHRAKRITCSGRNFFSCPLAMPLSLKAQKLEPDVVTEQPFPCTTPKPESHFCKGDSVDEPTPQVQSHPNEINISYETQLMNQTTFSRTKRKSHFAARFQLDEPKPQVKSARITPIMVQNYFTTDDTHLAPHAR